MVRIEDSSVTQFDNFLDTPIGRPVQIALVLAEFDKDIGLEFYWMRRARGSEPTSIKLL
jgi:hypothetical protein